MTRGAEATGVYVYCISEGEPFSAPVGLHPCRPVYSLVYDDLLAVVSRVPLEEFGEEGLRARLEDASWLEREVRAHEQVIEKVMEGRTVLPMKLCTIFHRESGVRDLLETRQGGFRSALARLRGKEEWELKMYQEPAPGAGAQPAKPLVRASGRAYLMQKRAAQLAAQEAAAEARRQAQRTYEKLVGWAEEVQLKPIAPEDSPGAPRLILDAVCLLARPHLSRLRQQLEELGDPLADKGMRLQLVGPWPPYHFSGQAQERGSLS